MRRRAIPEAPIIRAAGVLPFDPAAWLADAQDLGYRVWLVVGPNGAGVHISYPSPRDAGDTILQRVVPDAHHKALCKHLRAIGRVLTAEGVHA